MEVGHSIQTECKNMCCTCGLSLLDAIIYLIVKGRFYRYFYKAKFFASDFLYKFTIILPECLQTTISRQWPPRKARFFPVTKSLFTRLRTLGRRITTVHWVPRAQVLSKKSKEDLGTDRREIITDHWNITMK